MLGLNWSRDVPFVVSVFGDEDGEGGRVAEPVAQEILLGRHDRVRLAFVPGQVSDEGEDDGDIARPGGADVDGHTLAYSRIVRAVPWPRTAID